MASKTTAAICALLVLPTLAQAFGPDSPVYVSTVACGVSNQPAKQDTVLARATSILQSKLRAFTPGPRTNYTDEDGGEVGYFLVDHCLHFQGTDDSGRPSNFSQLYIWDGKNNLTGAFWFNNDKCTGTPDFNQQIPLKTCTNPQGAGTIWEVHQITDKAKFVGNNFVYEMFDDVDECTYNTNTEPIIMSTQPIGCQQDGDVDHPQYMSLDCDADTHTVTSYMCQDKTCTQGCASYFADMTVGKCYSGKAIAPQNDPSADTFDDLFIRVIKNGC